MPSRAGATRVFIRPHAAWALAASVACCALTCSTVASANAKRDTVRPAPAQAVAHATPAPSGAQGGASQVTPPGAVGGEHHEGAVSGGAQPAEPSARINRRQSAAEGKAEDCCTAGASRPSAVQSQREQAGAEGRRPARDASGPPQVAAAVPSAQKAGSEEGLEQEAAAAPAAARRAHEKKAKHGKGKEPKRKEPKGKEPKGKESKDTEHGQLPPASVHTPEPAAHASAVMPTAAPSSPTPAPSVPAAPAALTPPLIIGESPSPASGTTSRRAARGAASAGRRSVPQRHTLGEAPPLARALPGAATGTRATRSPAVSRRPAHRTQSQLVTTVTRIINVVPTLAWLVMGVLAALAFAFGASSRLVALRARRLARQRRELLEDVGLLQAALLPALPDRLGPVGTSAAYRPASGPGAGGDFYDVFALADGQLAVVVGDVSGHGREALPHTTLLRFTLRAYLEAGLSPRSALQAASPVLERQLGGAFATVVLATYEPRERILVYACAGHPHPVVTGSEPLAALTACSSPPIGAGQPTGRRQTVVSVPGQALACFFTDGVVEARVGRELFGTGRLTQTLAELGLDASASTLLDSVARQSDRHPDDMAACLLRVEGDQLAPSVQVEELELDRRDVARGRAERFLLAGGVEASEIDGVLRSVHSAVARCGGVVLELHFADGRPEVAVRPHNVAVLRSPALVSASAVG